MKNNCKVDEITADKMDKLSGRFFTLKAGFNLFLYCLESEIYSYNYSELYSFGTILNEYFLKTKEIYNELEFELGTIN